MNHARLKRCSGSPDTFCSCSCQMDADRSCLAIILLFFFFFSLNFFQWERKWLSRTKKKKKEASLVMTDLAHGWETLEQSSRWLHSLPPQYLFALCKEDKKKNLPLVLQTNCAEFNNNKSVIPWLILLQSVGSFLRPRRQEICLNGAGAEGNRPSLGREGPPEAVQTVQPLPLAQRLRRRRRRQHGPVY